MHKISIDEKTKLVTVLHANGNPLMCPFATPLIGQNSLGHMQQVRMPCNDTCPHFHFKNDKVTISCGNGLELIADSAL